MLKHQSKYHTIWNKAEEKSKWTAKDFEGYEIEWVRAKIPDLLILVGRKKMDVAVNFFELN